MYKIYYNREMIKDENLSSFDLAVYGLVNQYVYSNGGYTYVPSNALAYDIWADDSKPNCNKIRSSIAHLISCGYLEGEKAGGNYVITCEPTYYNYWTSIDIEKIYGLFKLDKINLFKLYLLVLVNRLAINHENRSYFVSNLYLKYYVNVLHKSMRTVQRYMDQLQDIHYIYVRRLEFHQSNYIGAYEDKDLIDSYLTNLI